MSEEQNEVWRAIRERAKPNPFADRHTIESLGPEQHIPVYLRPAEPSSTEQELWRGIRGLARPNPFQDVPTPGPSGTAIGAIVGGIIGMGIGMYKWYSGTGYVTAEEMGLGALIGGLAAYVITHIKPIQENSRRLYDMIREGIDTLFER